MTDDYDRISDDWYPAFFVEHAFHVFRLNVLAPQGWSDERQFAAWAKLDTLRIRRETGDLV